MNKLIYLVYIFCLLGHVVKSFNINFLKIFQHNIDTKKLLYCEKMSGRNVLLYKSIKRISEASLDQGVKWYIVRAGFMQV